MQRLKPGKAATLPLNTAIHSFNRGDAGAFDLIYRSCYDYVHRICLCMLRDPAEAEDAVQDVFVCVFCKIHTFRGESAFSTWLYRLTKNSILMRFRKNKHPLLPLQEPREDEGYSQCEIGLPDSHLRSSLDRIDLLAALSLLPRGYKRAVVLHDIHGYGHREIGRMFGYSTGNSKSQLHKAHLRLRTLLGGLPKKDARQEARRKSPSVG